jgi:hypothetical protein
MYFPKSLFVIFCSSFFFLSCSKQEGEKDLHSSPLFRLMPSQETGISFKNEVENTRDFNIFSYRNFYNGGGVAIGDINNDGLADIFFTKNMGSNKLYLNKGNWQFEDITEAAGMASADKWSTGVVFVDVNADGLLDIYVCNAGYISGSDQKNELFLNNGDLTFTEKAAAYQLDHNGYTTHAAFFDYDLDGDLDAYILNNSFIPVNTLNYSNKRNLPAEEWPVKDFLKGGGDKLLRNDNGTFVDVTNEAGIFTSLIGFGLGVTVGDVNGDHWPDMYISNDFFERDYLYINQKDGTFKEAIKDWMEHISLSSMGADMTDINNDGYPEIFVTEMLPEDDYRLKTTTLFEPYQIHDLKLKRDFYYQFMQNTLQYNNKDGSFSEIAHYSGVAASDWSWGALLFDADNDRYRDIFVCNGIYQDVTDQDFIDFFANEIIQEMVLSGKKEAMDSIINKMPSRPIPNKAYQNQGDLTFKDAGYEWGFDTPSFSNGAAYGDLDNDGDYDLIINNLNQEAFILKNTAETKETNHSVSIQLRGTPQNPFAIGSKIMLYDNQEVLNSQLIPSRGFQSSVDYKVIFGLGEHPKTDSLVIIWPDQSRTVKKDIPIDTLLRIDYQKEKRTLAPSTGIQKTETPLFRKISADFAAHQEDEFVDFFAEGLSFKKLSTEGPATSIGDVNGDGLEDLFVGNGAGHPAHLYIQTAEGFRKKEVPVFTRDAGFEDTAAAFFDADGDGDLDLFIGSGGNHQPMLSRMLQDRLYINDGNGNFELNTKALSANGLNTAVAVPIDYDGDGDLDLFVGSRSMPALYGPSPKSFLYENNGKGIFKDVIKTVAPTLERAGLITDATLADLNGDSNEELIVVGEWMSPLVYECKEGQLLPVEGNLSPLSGWWNEVEVADLNADGKKDLVLGNQGRNFSYDASEASPLKLWIADFDDNGTVEKIMTRLVDGKDKPVPLKKELTEQIVSLKKQNLKHTEYAGKSIQELFSREQLAKAKVKQASYFNSCIALNQGDGNFTIRELPREVQFSCICGILCTDVNGDNSPDIIAGGNNFGFTPQFSRQDASFGHVLLNDGKAQFEAISRLNSGFLVKGQIKHIESIQKGNQQWLIVLFTNEMPMLFELSKNPNLVQ